MEGCIIAEATCKTYTIELDGSYYYVSIYSSEPYDDIMDEGGMPVEDPEIISRLNDAIEEFERGLR